MAADAFDEMVTGQGPCRRHWQPLIAALSELGVAGLAERAARGRQQLEDEGVTYNLYEVRDSERGPAVTPPLPEQRPWQLDPVPLILSERDWAHIEAGVKQRAVLLDAVLRDFYGPMRLLKEGRYPPALVHSHKEFLRPRRAHRRPAGRADAAAAMPASWCADPMACGASSPIARKRRPAPATRCRTGG